METIEIPPPLSGENMGKLWQAVQKALQDKTQELGIEPTIHDMGAFYGMLCGHAYGQTGLATESQVLLMAIPKIIQGMDFHERKRPC